METTYCNKCGSEIISEEEAICGRCVSEEIENRKNTNGTEYLPVHPVHYGEKKDE